MKKIEVTSEGKLGDKNLDLVRGNPPIEEFKQILDLIEPKGEFEGVKIRTDFKRAQLNSLVVTAQRRGFNVGMRKTTDGWFIYKRMPGFSSEKLQRMQEINKRISTETLQQIADSLSLSRQRIQQLNNQYENFCDAPFGAKRSERLLEFMKPFIEIVKEGPKCLICKTPTLAKDKYWGACKSCRDALRLRVAAASHIRTYLKTNDHHYLSLALVKIRRFGWKPEDIKGM